MGTSMAVNFKKLPWLPLCVGVVLGVLAWIESSAGVASFLAGWLSRLGLLSAILPLVALTLLLFGHKDPERFSPSANLLTNIVRKSLTWPAAFLAGLGSVAAICWPFTNSSFALGTAGLCGLLSSAFAFVIWGLGELLVQQHDR